MHGRGVEGDPSPGSHSGGSTSASANVAWSARTSQAQGKMSSMLTGRVYAYIISDDP